VQPRGRGRQEVREGSSQARAQVDYHLSKLVVLA
jgi:hypothetical protein